MYRDLAHSELVGLRQRRRDAAAGDFVRYESRFVQWEQRASVRRKPRRVLEPVPENQHYFPPELGPAAGHPLVRSAGAATVHRFLVHRLHDYLHFTTELENLAVIPVASKISRDRAGLELPEPMRADAFKIVTDEAWHAQFSYDMVRQVELATGVPFQHPEPPAFTARLDAIRECLPATLRGAEGLLFAVVSETLISSILAQLPRDTRLPRAVRDLVRDHAEDEGRHHVYFRAVLRYFWPALDRSDQRVLGPLLPEIIFAFLEPDYAQVGRGLLACGLTGTEVEQVITESWPDGSVAREAATAAKSAIRYFQEVGALADPATAEAFAEAGLLG